MLPQPGYAADMAAAKAGQFGPPIIVALPVMGIAGYVPQHVYVIGPAAHKPGHVLCIGHHGYVVPNALVS